MKRFVKETMFCINCRTGESEAAVNNKPWAWFQISGEGSADEVEKLRNILSQHGYQLEKFESCERQIPILEG